MVRCTETVASFLFSCCLQSNFVRHVMHYESKTLQFAKQQTVLRQSSRWLLCLLAKSECCESNFWYDFYSVILKRDTTLSFDSLLVIRMKNLRFVKNVGKGTGKVSEEEKPALVLAIYYHWCRIRRIFYLVCFQWTNRIYLFTWPNI